MANATLPVLTGLMCASGNYVSQESFGNTLNASSANMRKNQVFAMETLDSGKVVIKTPKGTYMQANVKGEVTAGSKSVEDDSKFDCEVQADGSWAFKSSNNYYLCSEKKEQMYCHSNSVGEHEKFKIHLAMHPQITIYSKTRKAYVHLKDDELQVNEKLPWGYDAMVTCDFDKASAKYTIRAANGKYWSSASKLVDTVDDSCKYVIQLVNGNIAFKGSNGKFLSAPTSKNQIFHCEGANPGNPEQFVFEDSHGQVAVSCDGKYISLAKGDPTGTGKAVTDAETFQMEINPANGNWKFRTHTDKYFKVVDKAMTLGDGKHDATEFTLTYEANAVKVGYNNQFLELKPNGNLVFGAGSNWFFDVINRPQLILHTVFGFVTAARAGDGVGCNAASPYTFTTEWKDGTLHLKAQNGKYLSLNEDGSFAATSDSATKGFALEWRFHTKFAMLCLENQKYLKASQDGKCLAKAAMDEASLFEY